ncbi:DASH complex subunit SPC19 [Kwoniella mangroviensis CBS 10435]|uniref:DASH complex subunit SPC19 n=1 Tax=Kwoniella mangroviensis CBS 10435 TaxID=1331196 RepID=A0A1B9IMN5_9TREE|nr:DASH complex subunit SPC19 [Kwoniella mangroviensis CBS 10435]
MAYTASTRRLPRESIYPAPPSNDFLNALEDCVSATERCSNTLNAGLNRLQVGTSDLPRLTKVMKHKHHFLVLPEPTILAHKSALSSSLAPQIDQLIAKAESMVEYEKSKVSTLEERLSILQSARTPPINPQPSNPTSLPASLAEETDNKQDTSCKISDLNLRELSILQRKKVMMLKQKRERLEKELERLKSASSQ